MKPKTYQSAVEHLRFSEDLRQRVEEAAVPERPKHRLLRTVVLAAVMCMLLATTVFAAGGWLHRNMNVEEIGEINGDFSDAEVMNFTVSENTEGIRVHYMELESQCYYSFKNGMLNSAEGDFFRVTGDYRLEPVLAESISMRLEKNDREYGREVRYVEAEGGIYSDTLGFCPVEKEEILVCVVGSGSHLWPVYWNLESEEIRDALPDFTEDDFVGRVCYAQSFRDGILLSSIEEKENSNGKAHLYWVSEESRECMELAIPGGVEFVIGDTMYYKDRNDRYYVLDENFHFQKLEYVPKSTDDLTKGLLTVRNTDGTLGIVDFADQISYHITEIKVPFQSLQETTGYNATRHSLDGKIVVTYAFTDWETDNRPLDSIAFLDVGTGELKQLKIETDYLVETHGWLDDDRYGVIYEDGTARYLCIYEFTD